MVAGVGGQNRAGHPFHNPALASETSIPHPASILATGSNLILRVSVSGGHGVKLKQFACEVIVQARLSFILTSPLNVICFLQNSVCCPGS